MQLYTNYIIYIPVLHVSGPPQWYGPQESRSNSSSNATTIITTT